jgi:riboflavin kinase/FMN adenylyltransferase
MSLALVRLQSLDPLGWRHPAVTVGNFDGVHQGHQALLRVTVEEARAHDGVAVVLTFDPHPARILSPERAPASLMTLEQKAAALAALGADRLAVLPFTAELSQLPAETFAEQVLARALGARVVVVGSNFRFGHGRGGGIELLGQQGARLGFRVHGVEPVFHEGAPISSTRIRQALARGAVEAARELIGSAYTLEGTVVHGAGRGRTLGLPTANVAPENELVPGGGVYAAFCWIDAAAERWPAVVNVGHRPTFGGGATTVEAHLLGFDGDLYGQRVRLSFEARLREERPFADVGALVAQIHRDIEAARTALVPLSGSARGAARSEGEA